MPTIELYKVGTKIQVPTEVHNSGWAKIVSVDPQYNSNGYIDKKYGMTSKIAIYTLTSLSYPYYATHEEIVSWQK